MAESVSKEAPQPQPIPAGRRLESWKGIAAHLKRDVRTAKRWEKEEGLPVHRHLHKKLASVYAFEAELDAWVQSRRPRTEKLATHEPTASRRWWIAGLAAVVAIIGGAAFWLARSPVLPFAERDWILIANFENRTGEPVFDGTLEYALERELSNSRYVNVVPRERIGDTLQLMQKPPDTVIDRAVGREICLRDGGIRAFVTGRVEKLDSTYLLSAMLVNPANGVTVATFSEEALGQSKVVGALRRLSGRVRESLGEQLTAIQDAQPELEKVTTPSLTALSLYSQADVLVQQSHTCGEAAALLRQAVAEDPQFASAHILLAHCLSNLGKPQDALPHYQRAVELADGVPDPERGFIRASYYGRALRDRDKAIEILEPLVRLHPDHYWAVSNLWFSYSSRGRQRDAFRYVLRRADLRPHHFDHQLRAAHAALVWGDAEQAQPYYQRARRLVSAADRDWRNRWRAAWVKLYPVHAKWVQGDFEGALNALPAFADEIAARSADEMDPLRWEVGSAYLALGRVSSAREIYAGMTGASENAALVSVALGEKQDALRHLQRAAPSHRSGILLARLGLLKEADNVLTSPEAAARAYAPFLPYVWDQLLRAELALARGQSEQAIPWLEESLSNLRGWPTAYFFLAADALAQAREKQGDPSKALIVLQDAAQYRTEAVFWAPASLFWMKNELRRAQLYRRLDRVTEARQVEADLRKALALADPDHFILRQLDPDAAR